MGGRRTNCLRSEYHGEQYDRRIQVAGWNNFSMVALSNAKEWRLSLRCGVS